MSAPTSRPVSVEAGKLCIRLAESQAEIEASQRLRYAVFVTERNATPSDAEREAGREFDAYDPHTDHLLVFDTGIADGPDGVVGTYRLMRRDQAAKAGTFYTVDEYDITPLLNYDGEIMELGRSCVAEGYRAGATMQLLWRGIAACVQHFDVQLMFGCASILGTDPDAVAEQLSYLYHHHLAPPALRPTALPQHHVEMNRVSAEQLRPRRTAARLPPLIKGYLRLGGFVGDGAVVDHDFNTTDVCVVVKTDLVTDRYVRHLTRDVRGEG